MLSAFSFVVDWLFSLFGAAVAGSFAAHAQIAKIMSIASSKHKAFFISSSSIHYLKISKMHKFFSHISLNIEHFHYYVKPRRTLFQEDIIIFYSIILFRVSSFFRKIHLFSFVLSDFIIQSRIIISWYIIKKCNYSRLLFLSIYSYFILSWYCTLLLLQCIYGSMHGSQPCLEPYCCIKKTTGNV